MARLTAPDLAPLSLASASPDALPPCVAGTPSPVEGLLTQLKAALDTQKVLDPGAAPPSAEQAKAWAWLAFALHRTASADGSDDGLPERLILAAWQAQPGDPLVAMVAQNVLEDAARKHTILDEALRTHPNHPWLLSARARILIDSARDDASAELEDILARLDIAAPDALTPEVLLIQLPRSQKHLGFSAYERALSLRRALPHHPEALDTAARLSRNMFDTLTLQHSPSPPTSPPTSPTSRSAPTSPPSPSSNPTPTSPCPCSTKASPSTPPPPSCTSRKPKPAKSSATRACVRDTYKNPPRADPHLRNPMAALRPVAHVPRQRPPRRHHRPQPRPRTRTPKRHLQAVGPLPRPRSRILRATPRHHRPHPPPRLTPTAPTSPTPTSSTKRSPRFTPTGYRAPTPKPFTRSSPPTARRPCKTSPSITPPTKKPLRWIS